MSHRTVPPWALQRVETALRAGRMRETKNRRSSSIELARRTGLSKRLVRQCLYQLKLS